MSTLVIYTCVVLGTASWFVAALHFIRARRDYRGPPQPASWLTPFALWEPRNYLGPGAVRIRRSSTWFLVFIACVVIALVMAR